MALDRKIMIDCDPGTDDALALLLASVYLRERLLCFVSTYGNTTLSHTHGNLLGLSALLQLDGVPVYRGAACPMGTDGFVPTDYHGENGLCGITLSCGGGTAEVEGGMDGVYRLMKEAGKVIYVALGPLTNLAQLLERYPDAAEHIAEVVIMGGGFAVGNTDSGAEYNFSLDPESIKVVLGSGVKTKLVPLDLTHTLAFDEWDIEVIVGKSRADLAGDFASPRGVLGNIFYKNLDSSLRDGNAGAIIHDGAAVALLCGGCGFAVKEMGVRSDGMGRLFADEEGRNMAVVHSMSKADLRFLMKKAFAALG